MLFVAFNLDAEGMAARRAELLPAHRDYMAKLGDRVLWGGPLMADDGETKVGGMFVFRAEDRTQALDISQNDPFVVGGIYRNCETRAWRWQSGPDSLSKQRD